MTAIQPRSSRSNHLLDTLRRAGLRITRQRRAVCEYLAQADEHPTPAQVYQAVRQRHPNISRATVYNVLNTLRDLGAIVEIGLGSAHTHYETRPHPHVNVICLRCSRVMDFDGALPFEQLHRTVQEALGVQPVTTQVQVFAFCPECQAARAQEIRAQARSGNPHPPTHSQEDPRT